MRRCDTPEEVKPAFELVRSEAQKAFGNDDIFIEKFLVEPKHIEVQVLAGMDSIYAPALCQVDNRRNVQIGTHGALVFTDEIGLIRVSTELAAGILVGVHCHGMKPQVIAGPENSNGNFAAVCSQNLVKGFLCLMITSLKYYRRHLSSYISLFVHSAFIIPSMRGFLLSRPREKRIKPRPLPRSRRPGKPSRMPQRLNRNKNNISNVPYNLLRKSGQVAFFYDFSYFSTLVMQCERNFLA